MYKVKEIEYNKRRAVQDFLIPSITLMVDRVHSITADQLPNFPYLFDGVDPIEEFCKWRDEVKNLIEEQSSK